MFLVEEKTLKMSGKSNYIKGFALVEVLIAMAIISVVVISIYSGISSGAVSIAQTKDLTKAVIIAKSKMNEYKLARFRGSDISDKELENYPGFSYSRKSERYEHPLFPRIPAQKVLITVKWTDKNHEKSYNLSYIYATR